MTEKEFFDLIEERKARPYSWNRRSDPLDYIKLNHSKLRWNSSNVLIESIRNSSETDYNGTPYKNEIRVSLWLPGGRYYYKGHYSKFELTNKAYEEIIGPETEANDWLGRKLEKDQVVFSIGQDGNNKPFMMLGQVVTVLDIKQNPYVKMDVFKTSGKKRGYQNHSPYSYILAEKTVIVKDLDEFYLRLKYGE